MKGIYSQVKSMHDKFQIGYGGSPRVLPEEILKFRCKCLMRAILKYFEQVFPSTEHDDFLIRAGRVINTQIDNALVNESPDLEGQFKALLDLAVFTLGTVEQQGLPFNQGFSAVMHANMRKEVSASPENGAFAKDLIKPHDWKSPDLQSLIDEFRGIEL